MTDPHPNCGGAPVGFITDLDGVETASVIFAPVRGGGTAAQTPCQDAIHGDGDIRGTEIDAVGLDLVTFSSGNLAVPARRAWTIRKCCAASGSFTAPAAHPAPRPALLPTGLWTGPNRPSVDLA